MIRNQFGILREHGDLDKEQTILDRNHYKIPPDAPDNVQETKTLLYGPNGESILIKVPRRIGFKPISG